MSNQVQNQNFTIKPGMMGQLEVYHTPTETPVVLKHNRKKQTYTVKVYGKTKVVKILDNKMGLRQTESPYLFNSTVTEDKIQETLNELHETLRDM